MVTLLVAAEYYVKMILYFSFCAILLLPAVNLTLNFADFYVRLLQTFFNIHFLTQFFVYY